MTLREIVRGGLAGSAFLAFGIGGAILSWVVLPLASCDWNRIRRQRRCQRIVQATFVLFHDYMTLIGVVSYDPRRAPRPLPDGPFVLVTNHPTLVDVTALISAYGELCVVAKPALFRNPLLGPLLRLCGHINSGQSGFGAPAVVVEQAVERLRAGFRVLMFPEGTRSPEVGLRRFHAGAFQTALEAGVPVVPIAITAQPPGLKKGHGWWKLPPQTIAISLQALSPVRSAGYENARQLLVETRRRLERALGLEPDAAVD
jgi:1-acyl-sn-glycerol-3-phosphate acyltransferase